MNWYYADKGSQVGPISEKEFQSLVRNGTITSTTLVWNSGMKDWQEYGDLVRVQTIESAGETEAMDFPEEMTFSEYAGFWIRVGAKIIDWIILSVVNTVITAIWGFVAVSSAGTPHAVASMIVSYILQTAVSAAYTTWFLGKYGATPGKMACKIQVITSDGGNVNYLRAFARHFAEWISGIIIGIGYIMVAFDNEKRALHDRICDTRVIRKQ
jgi:uncharacterized RDD family membrane protein YckC